ncbi:MAG: rhodanese-like domain-containing protein [Desulfovibrio sp.]
MDAPFSPSQPCYAVIFSSVRSDADNDYAEAAADLATRAALQPGFLGMESAREQSGFGITISYWTDLEAIRAWKADAGHALAQHRGRSDWYEHFQLRVCRVERGHGFPESLFPAFSTPTTTLETGMTTKISAADYYLAKLAFETDSWDLAEALKLKTATSCPVVVIDARSPEAYAAEHIPGALNLPHRSMTPESTAHLDRDALYVTYCDGIGCNASTKGALQMARLGFRVKELLGGLDWWKRDGHATEGRDARTGASCATDDDAGGAPGCGCAG